MNNVNLKLERLIDLATILGQQKNFQEILRLVTQNISNLLKADITVIMMLNPQTQNTVKTIFKEGHEISHPQYKKVYNQVSGWLIKNHSSLLSTDIKNDSRFKNIEWKDLLIHSVMGINLQSEGNLIGSLILINKNKQTFSQNDVMFLEKIAVIVAPYLSNVQQLQHYFNAPLSDDAITAKYKALGLLGKSTVFNELLQTIEAAAQCDVRVLLEGESGTGKELVARAIHTFSMRSDKPFIAVDCGAIPEHLVESELFGHVKGAFSGATQDRKGLFLQADGGTLFLDEIANLPIDMQSKLLRVLQESEIRPLGSDRTHEVNVRVVAAASVSLQKMVEGNKFREDLYYRLHVYPVMVPSLNDRAEDISLIAVHFLQKFSEQQNKNIQTFDNSIVEYMHQRTWKGNIRELINFIERLVTLTPATATQIRTEIIPADIRKEFDEYGKKENNVSTKPLKDQLFDNEKEIIEKALVEHKWNQTRAAEALDISEQLIRYRIKKLGIKRP
jgi:Nif-specific regulatory protein